MFTVTESKETASATFRLVKTYRLTRLEIIDPPGLPGHAAVALSNQVARQEPDHSITATSDEPHHQSPLTLENIQKWLTDGGKENMTGYAHPPPAPYPAPMAPGPYGGYPLQHRRELDHSNNSSSIFPPA